MPGIAINESLVRIEVEAEVPGGDSSSGLRSRITCDLNRSTQHWHPTILWGFQTPGAGGATRQGTHSLDQATWMHLLINRVYWKKTV
jgi:hypothetical protein